jgi:hypothetical protein
MSLCRFVALGVALSWVGLASGQDPGLVVLVNENPQPVEFAVPENFFYEFAYDPARVALWADPGMQQPIPAGAISQVGSAKPGCERGLSQFASLQNCFTGPSGGVPPGCAGFNLQPDGGIDLQDYAAWRGRFIGPICEVVFLPVYVQGLTASTTLGDAVVTLLVGSLQKAPMTVHATQAVTVVSIGINPTTGPLGTPITITLQPAIAPIAFDSLSTATWSGVYKPMTGPPTAPFQILFNASQVRESGPGSALIVAGDGTFVNPPSFVTLDLPGSLEGSLTVNLGMSLARRNAFALTVPPAVWESITYLDTSISTGPPVLNGQPVALEIMVLSNDPNPFPDELVLLQSYWAHLAVVMRIVENATTIANSPQFIDVDLVTFNSSGVEIDRRLNVRLDRVPGNDGDPSNLVYQSDLTKPIVLVDVALDAANYPNVVLLHAEGSGNAQIVPH